MLDFNEYFYYDETSPSCLSCAKTRYAGRFNATPSVEKGQHVGYRNRQGYWVVKLFGKSYKVHRIIMQLFGVDCEGKIVDHRDQDKNNNHITNLRIVNDAVSCRNRSKRKDNSSGIQGVNFRLDKNGVGRWTAIWRDLDGIQRSKSFSESVYGSKGAFDLACSYRKTVIEELNKKGAAYSEIHGDDKVSVT